MSTTPAPQITLQDLALVRTIIKATSQRGAILPEEMVLVGTLDDKVKKVIDAATKPPANTPVPTAATPQQPTQTPLPSVPEEKVETKTE